jgi:hypothetical protein
VRAAWFRRELAKRGWTLRDLEERRGPQVATSQKMANGLAVSDSSLYKAIAALSEVHPVRLTDVPDN